MEKMQMNLSATMLLHNGRLGPPGAGWWIEPEDFHVLRRYYDPRYGEERIVVELPLPNECPWLREGPDLPRCAWQGEETATTILEDAPYPLECIHCQLYGDAPHPLL